ncbi:hypothetical protein ES703_54533 [subsurface metagenome]
MNEQEKVVEEVAEVEEERCFLDGEPWQESKCLVIEEQLKSIENNIGKDNFKKILEHMEAEEKPAEESPAVEEKAAEEEMAAKVVEEEPRQV